LLPLKLRRIKKVHQELRHTPTLDRRFVEANEAEALHKFSAKLVRQDLVQLVKPASPITF
jgi:hypothetical protein